MDLHSIKMGGKTLKGVYDLLKQHRDPYLERAKEASRLTVPSLFPLDGDTSITELEANFNSVGSEVVSALTAKIVLALFPPGQPFFRLRPTTAVRDLLKKAKKTQAPEDSDDMTNELDNSLAEAEQEIMRDFESLVPRGELHNLIEHLIVGGSACLWLPDDGKLAVVPLHSYVASRSGDDYATVVVRSYVARTALPPHLADSAPNAVPDADDGGGPHESLGSSAAEKGEVEVYTAQCKTGNDRYVVWQELADGTRVDIVRNVAASSRPLLPQTFKRLPREHYGRSLVENYLGDLNAVSAYAKSLVHMAAIMARMVGVVDPGGLTNPDDLNKAPNGTFVAGREADVAFLRSEKASDMAGVKAVLDDIVSRLRGAFLSNFATRRQGERVTAEEIRLLANELETTHAGAYSMLSQTLQRPLVLRVIERVKRTSETVKAVAKVAEPSVVTGLEALGRLAEITRLAQWAQVISSALGPEAFMSIVKPVKFSEKVAAALGVSTLGVHKTQTEIDTERRQAQQAQMTTQATEAAIKGGAPAAGKAFVESQVQQPSEQ